MLKAARATISIAWRAGFFAAEDGAGFAERLPFPKLGRAFGEVAVEGVERDGQRAALAGGAEAGVDFVQPAERAELVADADQPLAELAEEVAVDGAIFAAQERRVRRHAAAAAFGVAARFEQEDQVEIAVIVRLAAAELAEREDDRLADVAVARGEVFPVAADDVVREFFFGRPADQRDAELVDELLILAVGDLLEAGLGDIGQGGVRGADVVFADDVADADADVLGVFEAVQDRVDVFGAFAQFGERLARGSRAWAGVRRAGCPSARRSCPGCW